MMSHRRMPNATRPMPMLVTAVGMQLGACSCRMMLCCCVYLQPHVMERYILANTYSHSGLTLCPQNTQHWQLEPPTLSYTVKAAYRGTSKHHARPRRASATAHKGDQTSNTQEPTQ